MTVNIEELHSSGFQAFGDDIENTSSENIPQTWISFAKRKESVGGEYHGPGWFNRAC